jgi:hypothetical protein
MHNFIKPTNLDFDFEVNGKYDTVLLPFQGECKYYFPENNIILHPEVIFVFGSNMAGRHGKGAALEAAMNHGAIYGIGEGFMGSCYAIPTKNMMLMSLPLKQIQEHVERFRHFTNGSGHSFYVTAVGTGLAGYRHEDIAPMFKGIKNCWIPFQWKRFII